MNNRINLRSHFVNAGIHEAGMVADALPGKIISNLQRRERVRFVFPSSPLMALPMGGSGVKYKRRLFVTKF
jgi:hypothetical protein